MWLAVWTPSGRGTCDPERSAPCWPRTQPTTGSQEQSLTRSPCAVHKLIALLGSHEWALRLGSHEASPGPGPAQPLTMLPLCHPVRVHLYTRTHAGVHMPHLPAEAQCVKRSQDLLCARALQGIQKGTVTPSRHLGLDFGSWGARGEQSMQTPSKEAWAGRPSFQSPTWGRSGPLLGHPVSQRQAVPPYAHLGLQGPGTERPQPALALPPRGCLEPGPLSTWQLGFLPLGT